MTRHLLLTISLAFLVLLGPPARGQSNPLYLMIPSGTGFKIVRVEQGKTSEVAAPPFVKAYGYHADAMKMIGASKLWDFGPTGKPSRTELASGVVEYVTGPDRQLFFHDDSTYFLTVEFEKGKGHYLLNEAKGATPKVVNSWKVPAEIRNPLMTPVPGGLAVYSGQGNNGVTLFSFKDAAFRSLVGEKDFKAGPDQTWRMVFVPQQGLWHLSRAGRAQRLTDVSLKLLEKPVERALRVGGRVKKAVATALERKPAVLLGVAAKDGDEDITRLVYYDLEGDKEIDRADLDFKAVTFSIPDTGSAVYLVSRSGPSIVEYDPKTKKGETIVKLDEKTDLRDVRICPLSPK
ncbi:MAG: hypothetical protein HYS12_18785 [Planctomycetes bacterium]|nr:hypothetical protein [Planctomycetota bacterium]